MGRLALTLWFAVTALLGPGVCCCSFSSSAAPATPATVGGRPAPASKPVKSCCRQDAPPSSEQTPKPGEPAKCPCEQVKHAAALPPGGYTDTDLAAQLRLLDLFVGLPASLTSDADAAAPSAVHASPPADRPAGRVLLAAYSRLRC